MSIETAEQYVEAAMRTKSPHCALNHTYTTSIARLLNTAAVAGMMARDAKKAVFGGRPMDEVPNEQSLLATPLAKIDPDILHAALGVINEAGEIAQALVRALEGEGLDLTNLDEEFGDSQWFHALYVNARGIPLSQLWERNIAKLRARFPDKFDGAKMDDANRDKAAETAALRGES